MKQNPQYKPWNEDIKNLADKNVLRLNIVMVTQLSEYTKSNKVNTAGELHLIEL